MTTPRIDADGLIGDAQTATAQALEHVRLYGPPPADEDWDERPLPDVTRIQCALADVFDALVSMVRDTRLEPELEQLLWATANVFHRTTERLQRRLHENEAEQRRSQDDQDGSEVRSVALERLLRQGQSLLDRREVFEDIRDEAARLYDLHLGSAWRPRTGSMINRRTLTATLIDSRDFLMARRCADQAVLIPKGTRVAFAGGVSCNDHGRIWDALDRVHSKYRDMILLHGGAPRGAERIAACWADQRCVTQIAFKPDWAQHAKAAPFRRNDLLLDVPPIGVVVFPGSGVTDNLADKARKMGIPILDYRRR